MYRPNQLEMVNFISHKYSRFKFHQGKAVLVVGQNLDKEGQKGNGAGKSTINEGISVAIAGTSIRDVLTRELVRDGEESATVILTLDNLRDLTKPLIIERTIYASKNKSSTCKVWIGFYGNDDDEVRTCPDINAYNKYIFDTIGISRDDFFNFYLITKEKYQAFFSIGDTQKKVIINRFSGANSIDGVDDLIKFDSSEKQSEINAKSSEGSIIDGKVTLLEEQITEEEGKGDKEEIDKKTREINRLIGNEEVSKKEIETAIETLEKQKEKEERELEEHKLTIPEDNTETYKEIDEQLKQIPKDREMLQNSLKDTNVCKADVDRIKEEEEACEKEVEVFTKEKREKEVEKERLERVNKNLNNQLEGNITCPKCSHEFNLQEEDFDINVAKETIVENIVKIEAINERIKVLNTNIKEYDEVFEELTNQKNAVNAKVKAHFDGIRAKISNLDTIEGEWRDLKRELDDTQKAYDDKGRELEGRISRTIKLISTKKTDLETSKNTIESYQTSLKKVGVVDKVRIEELKKQIDDQKELRKDIDDTLEQLTKEKQAIDSWLTNFKNFKSFVANQSIANITDYTNYFLRSISSNISIKVDGYKTLSTGKLKEEISTTVYKDGFEKGSYGKFSAGERGRIEICCILAIRELVNLNSATGGLDLLVCDEILDSVDSLGLELLIDSLQPLNQTIMIVSQNEINALSENTILIRKENGISEIVG